MRWRQINWLWRWLKEIQAMKIRRDELLKNWGQPVSRKGLPDWVKRQTKSGAWREKSGIGAYLILDTYYTSIVV